MLIIKPYIFNKFPEILCGFSTKIGLNRKAPYYFNMSNRVGDDSKNVDENREAFFEEINLESDSISFQTQVHGDKITAVDQAGSCGESDALLTSKNNLGLVISSADCPAIFIYDKENKIIAAVHSGWRSTAKKILKKTLFELKDKYDSSGKNLICYIGPSISQANYRVGEDVVENFEKEFIEEKDDEFFLDLKNANYKILLEAGVKENNIQVSKLCTYEYSNILHSYRRDGENSGRAIGVIAMRATN
jgi:YfiH family protein